jgi:hypothetical protein
MTISTHLGAKFIRNFSLTSMKNLQRVADIMLVHNSLNITIRLIFAIKLVLEPPEVKPKESDVKGVSAIIASVLFIIGWLNTQNIA